MATCSLSGAVCEDPVVCVKTGYIFERRLIEKHLTTSRTCPISGDEMDTKDLIAVKSNRAIKPRPPTATSIPSLLQLMQNEWDAVVLETHQLKQQLHAARQELAHALYQHDAACRVIARLIRERDQAQIALSDTSKHMTHALAQQQQQQQQQEQPQAQQSSAASGAGPDSSAAGEESGALGAEVGSKMKSVASALSKTRKERVRALVARVVQPQQLAAYVLKSTHTPHSASQPGITALDIHPTDSALIATGGNDCNAVIFNHNTKKIVETLKGHKKKVTDVKFHPTRERLMLTTSSDCTAAVWRSDSSSSSSSSSSGKHAKFLTDHHSAEVVGASIHASGDYFVTASADRSWCFFDFETLACRLKVTDDKVQAGYTKVTFHPDGLILGLGSSDAVVRIFDVRLQKLLATFKGHTDAIGGVAFSENGYYLSTGDAQGAIKLWDLRKLANFNTLSPPQSTSSRGVGVNHLEWDMSGSYLSVASASDLRLYAAKTWDLVKSWSPEDGDKAKDITCCKFGTDVSFVATTSLDRTLKIFAPPASGSATTSSGTPSD